MKLSLLSVPIISILMMLSGYASSANAAILSDSTTRRIVSVQPTQYATTDNIRRTINNNITPINDSVVLEENTLSDDKLQQFIRQKQQQYDDIQARSLTIQQTRRRSSYPRDDTQNQQPVTSMGIDVSHQDFNRWINANPYRASEVANYQRFLSDHLGANNVPPMSQLLTTARSWQSCGYEPYQVPPQHLWRNMLPTLQLYGTLRSQGLLPASTQIRSVYRNSALNECAEGAANSKHLTNGAIDIWVPEYQGNLSRIHELQDGLCQFWQYQGREYNFGLGLYSTGSIHLDTQGFRKWGSNHSSSSSPCKF